MRQIKLRIELRIISIEFGFYDVDYHQIEYKKNILFIYFEPNALYSRMPTNNDR